MSSISIVIVNYNSKHFLDLCLHSVERALKDIDSEVYVVDNDSKDDSQNFIMPKYPWVKWIQNEINGGFSKANNQAIPLCTKRYVLLLNPDTIVPEDCFSKTINFMEAHDECGALGVKMVDGNGYFLPESKRGLPTPMVSFYKLSGLHTICPKSKRCSKYYMGNVPPDKTAKVEILTGAFMLLRRLAVQRIGLLDEGYFMYGEDVDYSYRVLLGGYLNYYFPEVTIIHFKGESTCKDAAHVKTFYFAMRRFGHQYFSHNRIFFISFEPALFLISRLALIKSHISTFLKAIWAPKGKLPKTGKIVVFGFDDEDKSELQQLMPKVSIISDNNPHKRSLPKVFNISNLNIKQLIDSLYTQKGAIFFLAPHKDFILKSSDSKSVGKVFPLVQKS